MTDYINTSPHELLAIIFSYVDRKELIKYVQNVCKRWKKVVRKTSHLWTKFLYVPLFDESAEKIEKFLEECPMVQRIWFQYFNRGVGVGEVIAKHCTRLRKLDFSHGKVVIPYVEFDSILTCNVNIDEIGVYVNDNEEALKIVERIGNVKKLKTLILFGSEHVKFRTQPLTEGCKLLEVININTFNFNTENLVFLLENMKNQILRLYIEGEFSDDVMAAIGGLLRITSLRIEESRGIRNRIKSVSSLKGLKTLTKFFLSVGERGQFCSDSKIFKSVIECQWQELKELLLFLYTCDDQPDKLKYLGDVYPNLKTLYLEYYSQTQRNIEASWCSKLLELNALTLIGNWKVDDEFCISLRQCQKLRFFRVPEAKDITDESVDSLGSLKNLSWLELKECPMTKAAKQRLRQLLPNKPYFYITRHYK